MTVANLSPSPSKLTCAAGDAKVLAATGPTWQTGEEVPSELALEPWESVVLQL
jgi:hypothetical protein